MQIKELTDQLRGQPYTQFVSWKKLQLFVLDRFFHAELQSFISSLTQGNFYKEMSDTGARHFLVNASTRPKQPFETIACNQQKARENGTRKF